MIPAVLEVNTLAAYTAGLGDDLLGFSKPLSMAFRIFHVFHFYTRIIPRHRAWAEMYENNKVKFLACAGGGAGLYVFYGASTWAQIAGKSVRVALAVPDIRDAQIKVHKAYNKFMDVLTGTHPFPVSLIKRNAERDKMNPENEYQYLYALTYLPDCLFELALRIEALCIAAWVIIKECVNLSIASFGILDAVLQDSSHPEGMTGVGFNAVETYEKLIANPDELVQKMEENKEGVNLYLKYMKSPYEADKMKDIVRRTKTVHQVVQQAVATGGQMIYNSGFLVSGRGISALAPTPRQLIPV